MNISLRNITSLTLLAGTVVAGVAQNASFKRAAKIADVSYVYLSKGMLSTMGNAFPIPAMGGVAEKLTSLEILSTDNADSAAKVADTLEGCHRGMELMSHVSEAGDITEIYGVKDGAKLSDLLVLTSRDSGMTAILISGDIDPAVIKSVKSGR